MINKGRSENPLTLNVSLSIYLDLLRILAALLVFTYHAKTIRLNSEWFYAIGSFGHDAVIIFFVLSGFVIAYTADKARAQNADISSFMKSRVARLFSVAVPALVFTIIADSIGQHIKPERYVEPYYIGSSPVLRFLCNLFFLNEIWFSTWRAFSNGPFWSLCYEFFYYLLFSAAFFLNGLKRIAGCCAIALIAGPKILLLLPTWLLGVLAYKASKHLKMTATSGLFLSFSSLFTYIFYRFAQLPTALEEFTQSYLGLDIMQRLNFSQWFLNDYVVSTLIAIHLVGVAAITSKLAINKNTGSIIRRLAGITFTLYLFHYPQLLLYSSILSNSVLVVLLTLTVTALISPLTDGQKQRWLTFIDKILPTKPKPVQRGIKLE